MPNVDTRVAAIYRRGRAIMPIGQTVIEADDEVFFVAARENIRAVMNELRRSERPYKRIMIAGGGNIGLRLAKKIENRYSIKIFELSQERCKELSEELNYTVVLQGSASDQDLLLEENIEETDVFLSHVRSGDMVNVHSLRRSAAEAIEVVAHGDSKTSKVVGRTTDEIDLPDGASIGAILRETETGKQVLIAHDNTVIENGDHMIVFLVNKRYTKEVEKLFQVGFSFF